MNQQLQHLVDVARMANRAVLDAIVTEQPRRVVQARLTDEQRARDRLALFVMTAVQDGYVLSQPTATNATTWTMIDEDTNPILCLDNRLNGGAR